MAKWPKIDVGISGIRFENEDEVVVFFAQSESPGEGNFSAYVDERMAQHPRSKTVRASMVTNQIVRDMLLRRGFVEDGLDLVRWGVPEEDES